MKKLLLLLSLIITLSFLSGCKKENLLNTIPNINDSIPIIDTTNIDDTIIIQPIIIPDTILSYTIPTWNWLIGGIFQWQPGIRPTPSENTTFIYPTLIIYSTKTGTMDFGTEQYITILIGRHNGYRESFIMPIKRSDPTYGPRENFGYFGTMNINYIQ